MIKVIESVEGLEAVRAEWSVLARTSTMQVFQTFEWCYWAWVKLLAEEKGNRLYVLAWTGSKGESPIILPAYLDAQDTLRFLNDVHSDCCDAVYVRGGNKHLAFKEILEFIQADGRVRRVVFQKMHAESEFLHYSGVLWKDAVVYRDNTYSWVDVPRREVFIEGLVHMRNKDRACLRAILRKSGDDEIEIASVARGRSFPRAEIVALRTHMRQMNRAGDFLPDPLVDFVERIYQAGLCEIVLLKRDEHVKSLSFQMIKDARSLCWIFLYEDPAFNLPLYLHYFDQKVREADLTIDFGVGTYDYKMGSFRPVTACTFGVRWGRGYWDALRCFADMNLRLVKDFLKVRLRKGK